MVSLMMQRCLHLEDDEMTLQKSVKQSTESCIDLLVDGEMVHVLCRWNVGRDALQVVLIELTWLCKCCKKAAKPVIHYGTTDYMYRA